MKSNLYINQYIKSKDKTGDEKFVILYKDFIGTHFLKSIENFGKKILYSEVHTTTIINANNRISCIKQ